MRKKKQKTFVPASLNLHFDQMQADIRRMKKQADTY